MLGLQACISIPGFLLLKKSPRLCFLLFFFSVGDWTQEPLLGKWSTSELTPGQFMLPSYGNLGELQPLWPLLSLWKPDKNYVLQCQ